MFAANTIPTPALPLKGREQEQVDTPLKGREQERPVLCMTGRKLNERLKQKPSSSRGGLGGDGVQPPQTGATN